MVEAKLINEIMLDLETMGTAYNSAIVAIGATKFNDDEIIDTYYRAVDLESSMKLGLVVDGETINWWLKQTKSAQEWLFKDVYPIKAALLDLGTWMQYDPIIWGNGASFDNVILRHAYSLYENYRIPWSYKNDRCYRTLRNDYPDVELKPRTENDSDVYHYALDDAIFQTRHLIEIRKKYPHLRKHDKK